MIVINNLEELEPYRTKTAIINDQGVNNLVTYKFKEHGKLAAVTFNCEIPFGILDFGQVVVDASKNENDLPDVDFGSVDYCQFIAKEIYANQKLRVAYLAADTFVFKDTCEVFEDLQVKNKIVGTNLECEFTQVVCKEIDCDSLIADSVICGKLRAKSLITKNNQFENIVAENVNMFNELVKLENQE